MAEQLSGDSNLISLRSRATMSRPFTVVKKMQARAEDRYRSKLQELQKSLQDTQNRLNELQKNKESGQRFILSPEQQAEITNFQRKEAEMKKELKRVKRNLNQEIDALENQLKWINIAGMPFLVTVSGVSSSPTQTEKNGGKMNSKQLSILLVLGLVIGGLGLQLVIQGREASYKSSDQKIGKKVLGEFPINDVAQITIKNATNELNLVKQDDLWKVRERFNYPANFSEISEFVRKTSELKAVQSMKVGLSQFARFELIKPEKAVGTNSGTLVEFKDKNGKPLKSLLLGKKYVKESQSSSQFGGGDWPIGRYVMVLNQTQEVAIVSDPLSNVEPKPDQWLNKDFVKVEKLQTVSLVSTNTTNSWKVTRETETGEWKLADKKEGEELDKGKSSSLNFALSSPSFNDVASPQLTPEATGWITRSSPRSRLSMVSFTPRKLETRPAMTNYYLAMAVKGNWPTERTAGKDEKPEDKEKLDKEFKEKATKLKEKFDKEKAIESWTYLVSKWTIDPLLKERKDLLAEKKDDTKKDEKVKDQDKPNVDDLFQGGREGKR